MNKLRTLRDNLGYTQEELSKQLGMSRDTYKNYEQQRTEMGYDMLVKLADYFGCSIDYLLGHQTTNTLQLDGMTDDQKQLIAIVQKLDARQTSFAIGYFSDMLGLPYSQARPARPF